MVEELCDASSCTLSPAPSSGTNSPASSNNGTNSTSGACCRSTPSIATTAATNTLPPCRVCGEKASGFHYGVNTCEACKGFFRRSLQRKDQYKCLGSGQCKIGIGRRSNCPSCRYLKCLSVGMSKSAIKTGRYTHEKRTQDILEVKQMQFSQAQSPRLPPSELGSWKSQVSPPTPAQASSPSPASSIVRKPNSLRQESSTAFDPTSPSAFESSPVSAIQPTQLSVSDTTPHSALKSNQTSAVHPTHSSTSDPTSDSTPINSNQTSAVDLIQSNSDPSLSTSDPPSDTVPTLCSQIPPTSVESTTIMIWTPRPGSSFTPEPAAVHPQSSSSPCQREASTGNHLQSRQRRGYAHDDRLPSMMPLVTPMPPMPPTPPEDTEDYDSVIAMLVDAHKKYIISHTFTPFNVLRERQIKYFEDFQRKEEMFGSLSTLPQEQYMEIFEKTGMDVDNRQEMITFFASQMEAGMKRYINFVKNIPCFSELPIDDQAALIKAARYEFWFCGSFPGYNGKLKVVCLPSGKNLHIKEMCKLWERDFVLETFRLAETFHKLPLFPDEFVLIKCLCVLFADRCELRNQPKVEDIQWKLVQCLLHLLRKNHSSSTAVFAKIIDRLTELRSLTEWNYKIARNLQIWPAIHQSPLMVEMLSV